MNEEEMAERICQLEKENKKLQKENEELRNFIQDHGMLYRRRDNL